MDFALEALADGRRVKLEAGKPVLLKVRRAGHPGGEIAVGLKDGRPFLDNRSEAVCLVNGVERAAALISPGDQLQLGAQQFRLLGLEGDVEVVEPLATPPPAAAQPPAPSTESDRQRNQRRISASRMASIDAPQATGTSGLLKRVSAAFSGRAEKGRLDQLEAERRDALLQAGRRSLADGSALGLPAAAMSQLQRGGAIRLEAKDLEGLASWREDRQRLVRLDAEIAALRQALGLGPDAEAVVLTPLRSTEQAKVERAFATMDEVGTQSLDEAPPAEPPPAAAPPPRRSGPHRRR